MIAGILLLLSTPGILWAQIADAGLGWHGHVTDSSGAPIGRAHVYVRDISTTDESEPVTYVVDSDDRGNFAIPPSKHSQDVIVFAQGFLPWTGYIAVSTHNLTSEIHMKVVPCSYPGVNCDTFEAPSPKQRKKASRR